MLQDREKLGASVLGVHVVVEHNYGVVPMTDAFVPRRSPGLRGNVGLETGHVGECTRLEQPLEFE
jgi:hypothetical protein